MNKFIMLVGLPGSGKSHVAQSLSEDAVIVSSDAIRAELWGDENDQQNPNVVFSEMELRTHEALSDGFNVIYDATNLNSRKRKATVAAIKAKHDVECICVLVLCSIKECKLRNCQRERHVPEEVIDRMVRNFQVPFYHEGWNNIVLLDNGPKQDIEHEHERLRLTPHDNHHHTTGSIGHHCLVAYAAMRNRLASFKVVGEDALGVVLCEAAFQHDVGKRKCKVFHNSKGEPTEEAHYYNHENVGAYLWLSGNEREEWTDSCFLLIGLLIQLHMMPYTFPNKSKEELTNWCIKRGYGRSIADMIWEIHEVDLRSH